ncbi:MAG TPA: serine/threonine-protein phosphatase, partial [Polyangiaceae bacterium]|nr:serine/threonine-protein phosphatase [Polyangiaceae bacterium]
GQANRLVFRLARTKPELADMGTTLVALRFAPNKQRLYVGHVGDSRCYRLRGTELRQLTTDHVMRTLGLKGARAGDLFNAVGLRPEVSLDLVIDKPRPGDTYLLCSDGLPKMVSDELIRDTLIAESDPEAAVYCLIERANDAGGKDNVTVLLAKVLPRPVTDRPVGAGSNSTEECLA